MKGYTTPYSKVNDISLGGGLKDGFAPFLLENKDASGIQNIDFSQFGGIAQRGGYAALNTTAITGGTTIDGLAWYEYDSGGNRVQKLISVHDGDVYKMDGLDGTWDDITGAVSITAGNRFTFAPFNGNLYMANDAEGVLYIDNSLTLAAATMPTSVTSAKIVVEFQNYLIYLNVIVSGSRRYARLYYSNFNDPSTFDALDFIDIANDDGQEITGAKILGDRLVVYKNRSIYNVMFTGDADIPFAVYRSNSSVGAASAWSIQEVLNGHIFLSYDGIYYYDGMNSAKISDDINTTFQSLNLQNLEESTSLVYRTKNMYWISVPSSASSTNDTVLVYNFFLKAWSVYDGIDAAYMQSIYVGDGEERPYFGDYAGFVYRGDTGVDDYPLNVATAIASYYDTNWRTEGSLVSRKTIAALYIYYKLQAGSIDVRQGYNLDSSYSNNKSFSTAIADAALYDTAIYGSSMYSKEGYDRKIIDFTNDGFVHRFRYGNSKLGESWEIVATGYIVKEITDR